MLVLPSNGSKYLKIVQEMAPCVVKFQVRQHCAKCTTQINLKLDSDPQGNWPVLPSPFGQAEGKQPNVYLNCDLTGYDLSFEWCLSSFQA